MCYGQNTLIIINHNKDINRCHGSVPNVLESVFALYILSTLLLDIEHSRSVVLQLRLPYYI